MLAAEFPRKFAEGMIGVFCASACKSSLRTQSSALSIRRCPYSSFEFSQAGPMSASTTVASASRSRSRSGHGTPARSVFASMKSCRRQLHSQVAHRSVLQQRRGIS